MRTHSSPKRLDHDDAPIAVGDVGEFARLQHTTEFTDRSEIGSSSFSSNQADGDSLALPTVSIEFDLPGVADGGRLSVAYEQRRIVSR